MIDSAFWDEIEAKFMEYENLLGDLRFSSQKDVERYHLSVQTEGKVESSRSAYFFAQDHRILAGYVRPLIILGIPLPEELQNMLALKDIKNVKDVRTTILNAIKNRDFSPEFINDWGDYNFAAGIMISFIQSEESWQYHKQAVGGNVPEIAERCFYSFWMNEHWLENEQNSKDDAQYALADRIAELTECTSVNLPAWKIERLKNMLDGNEIKPSLLNLSKKAIRELVERHSDISHLFDLK